MLAVGGSVLAGALILPGSGPVRGERLPALSLGNGADLRAACGSVLYLTLIALLAFGVTAAVRDAAAGIGLVLGLLLLFPIMSAVIPDEVLARHLEQVAPDDGGPVRPGHGRTWTPCRSPRGRASASPPCGRLARSSIGAAVLRLRDA